MSLLLVPCFCILAGLHTNQHFRKNVRERIERDIQDPWKSFCLLGVANTYDTSYQCHIIQVIKRDLQDPWTFITDISGGLLWMFGLVARGYILRFIMYKMETCIRGRYGLHVVKSDDEQNTRSIAVHMYNNSFMALG